MGLPARRRRERRVEEKTHRPMDLEGAPSVVRGPLKAALSARLQGQGQGHLGTRAQVSTP